MNVLTAALLCTLAVVALSAPQKYSPIPVPILALNQDGPNPDGSYSYNYETGNGIQVQEQGQLAKIAVSEDAVRVQGFFSYPDPDGNTINLSYVADENGFRPRGEHLPVAPEIPSGILKALEYIAQHPEEDHL